MLALLGQAAVDGVLLGLVYTVMAAGLSLTLGVLQVVNVAHGTFVMLGSFLALGLLRAWGADPLVSVVVALPLFFLAGAVVERGLIRRVARAPQTLGLLILFGLMVAVESVAILLWTTDTRVITVSYTNRSLHLGPFTVSQVRLVAGAVAVALVALLHAFLQSTALGKAIRAVAQNRDAATILGIDVDRLSTLVFGLGTATAGAGGVVLGMLFPFDPQTQIQWLTWSFLVVLFGGLGGVAQTLAGGLTVGLIQAFASVVLPFRYVYLVVYGLLATVLVLRGQGLMGVRRRAL